MACHPFAFFVPAALLLAEPDFEAAGLAALVLGDDLAAFAFGASPPPAALAGILDTSDATAATATPARFAAARY